MEINFVPEKGRVIRENNGKNEYCFLQSGIHVSGFFFFFLCSLTGYCPRIRLELYQNNCLPTYIVC